MGKSFFRMGRPNGTVVSGSGPSGCCGCKSWSWLLYLLILCSFSLSIFVFWMTLYKQQEVSTELAALTATQNATLESLGLQQIRWLVVQHERRTETLEKDLAAMASRLKDLAAMPSGAKTAEQGDGGSAVVAEMKGTYGALINSMAAKMSLLESASESALSSVGRMHSNVQELETRLSSAEAAASEARAGWLEAEARLDTLEVEQAAHNASIEAVRDDVDDMDEARRTLVDDLLRDEVEAEKRMSEVWSKVTKLAEEVARLSSVTSDVSSDVAMAINATAYLEQLVHSGLASEARANGRESVAQSQLSQQLNVLNVTLHRRIDDLVQLAHTLRTHSQDLDLPLVREHVQMQQMEAEPGAEASATALSPSSSSPTSVELTLSLQASHLRELSSMLSDTSSRLEVLRASHESRLAGLEQLLMAETAVVGAHGKRLDHLADRVNHFVSSLLKVTKLPAEVNAIAMRIEVLDETVAKAMGIVNVGKQ